MRIIHHSSYAFNNHLRTTITEQKRQLVAAQKELSTGMVGDIGLKLRGQTSLAAMFDAETKTLDQIVDTNKLLGNRLSLMQSSLEAVTNAGSQFFNDMTVQMTVTPNPTIIRAAGESLMGIAHSALNVSVKGEYLYSGINTDQKALNDYYGNDGAAAKQAVLDAFEAHFGFAITDAQTKDITAAELDGFIDGDFQTLYDDANWSALWSNAADRGIRSRISQRELVETRTTALSDGVRQMVSASVLAIELSQGEFSPGAFQHLAKRAASIAAKAGSQLGNQQIDMGMLESRIEAANNRISAQKEVLQRQTADLIGVDPYEAALKVKDLEQSLEASFTVSSRIHALTLLNYM